MRFEIRGRFYGDKTFPSLNDLLRTYGANPKKGSRMKLDYELYALNAIRTQIRGYKAEHSVIIHYEFYEPSRGQLRDVMNVFSFADKVIEDALVKAKVISDDNPLFVINTTHEFHFTEEVPYISVTIEEVYNS